MYRQPGNGYKKTDYKRTIDAGYPIEEDDGKPYKHRAPLDFKSEWTKSLIALKILLGVTLLVVFAIMFCGCATNCPPPEVKYITRTETQEVKTPVMPKIPEISCEFAGNGLEPTRNLLACLIYHKRVLSILRSGKINPSNGSVGDQIDKLMDEMYPEDENSKVGKLLK